MSPAALISARSRVGAISASLPRVLKPQDLACEVINKFEDLEQLSSEWDWLWQSGPELSIFQNFRWMRAFWRAYGDELQACSLVARHGENVVGILPLVVKNSQLQFMGMPESDYNDVICRTEHTSAVVHAFVRYLFEMPVLWRRGLFYNVPSTSQLNEALRVLPQNLKRHFYTEFYMPCPTIRLDHDRDETFRRLLHKQSLKRHENKLKKLGAVTFRHLHDRDEIRRHLDNFFEQHTARYLLAGEFSHRPLQFQRPRSRVFYNALIDELDPSSELRFGVVEVRGRPVAYHLGFQSKRTYLWYKPTFDVDFWEYSPGEVLLRNLLRYARDSEVEEFDFTIGNEPFKDRFANYRKHNLVIYLERNPVAAGSIFLKVIRHGKGWLKRRPRVLDLVRHARRSVRTWVTPVSQSNPELYTWAQVLAFAKAILKGFLFSKEEILLLEATPAARHNKGSLLTEPRPATLSDLVRLAIEQPGFLSSPQLQAGRNRFRAGDRAYIARQHGSVHVIWCSTEKTQSMAHPSRAPGKEATVVEVYTSSRDYGHQPLADAIRYVLAKEATDGPIYTICNINDIVERRAYDAAGFSVKLRGIAVKIFGMGLRRFRPLGPKLELTAKHESQFSDFSRLSK